MNRLSPTGRRERRDGGQIIVIFALAAVAIIGMVGLVLDGGSTYAQRRGQQNAADLAAIAAANQYLLTDDKIAGDDDGPRRSRPRTGSTPRPVRASS